MYVGLASVETLLCSTGAVGTEQQGGRREANQGRRGRRRLAEEGT